jgi:hypothetical protein
VVRHYAPSQAKVQGQRVEQGCGYFVTSGHRTHITTKKMDYESRAETIFYIGLSP